MKCPTCNSPSPHLHPAMNCGGEVQPCSDKFHTESNRTECKKKIIGSFENIYAYTETGSSLPAFVSLNVVDEKLILSVRSRGSESPATIELEPDDLEDMAADILNYLHPEDMPERVEFSEPNEADRYRNEEEE